MQERYAVTVDLGTSVISLAVSRLCDGSAEVMFYKEAPSEGIRRAQVFNPLRCQGVLKGLVAEAEEALGVKINSAIVGLPRYRISQTSQCVKVSRSDEDFITEEELESLAGLAKGEFMEANRNSEEFIYGGVAQSYSIDDTIQASREDVIGASSSVLEGNFKIFHGSRKPNTGIQRVFNGLGIAIEAEYFVPTIQGHVVLQKEELENGCALIEIGGGVTSVSIWRDSILRYYASIPFGGKSITADIKHECACQETLAENIKLAFGACTPEQLGTLSDKVLQISDPESGMSQQLSVKYLSEVIGSRMNEIASTVMHLIHESGYADRLRGGIVLCGGAAETVGAIALFQGLSGMSVRRGYPRTNNISVQGCEGLEELNTSAQITLVTLASVNPAINCCQDEAEVTPPAIDTEIEAPKETLFEDEETAEVVREEERKPKEKKVKEPKKPKEPRKKPSFFNGIFGMVEDTLGTLFDDQDANIK